MGRHDKERTCWHCGRQFQFVKGRGRVYAAVVDPIGNVVRVHKDCVKHVTGNGYKEVKK